jgi:hypothetical protein
MTTLFGLTDKVAVVAVSRCMTGKIMAVDGGVTLE